MFDPEKLARENIQRLGPYSSARHEFAGAADIFLDANENAYGSPTGASLNRYPDPAQLALKEKIAAAKGVSAANIFVGSGSDEAIDLLFRIFAEPRRDQVILCPPTYGMYKVAADINDVRVREIPLTSGFQLDLPRIKDAFGPQSKLLFICSPNNPTGNVMRRDDILELARCAPGFVVVDEAYIDFSMERSLAAEIEQFSNLVVLQTFSKAWGLAGARVGMAFAHAKIIDFFNLVKPPYNVSSLSQEAAGEALLQSAKVSGWVEEIIGERQKMRNSLTTLNFVERIFPSDANFLLIKVTGAVAVYKHLLDGRVVVRDRSSILLCEGCLRITVGTADENKQLIEALKTYESEAAKSLVSPVG